MEGKYLAVIVVFVVAFSLVYQSVQLHDGFGKMFLTQLPMTIAAILLIGTGTFQLQNRYSGFPEPSEFVSFQLVNLLIYIGMVIVSLLIPKIIWRWEHRGWANLIEESTKVTTDEDSSVPEHKRTRLS